jgi:hypothetical protein
MVADPFFCLKIGLLKATVRRVSHPLIKTGSIDSADFAVTQLLAFYFPDCGNSRNGWGDRWHFAAVTAQYAKVPICHSRQILADFTTTRLLIYRHVTL